MAEAYTVVALSPLRRAIANRMAEAKRTIPHFRLVSEIELDALIEWRRRLQSRDAADGLSLNDVFVKACGAALMDVPAVNAQWVEGEIHQYRTADIAVVTAIEGGLSTPIVRDVGAKSIWEISREVRELAARAARNALKMREVFGGSFSISNLGMYGIDQFDAIINPPQCAMLAVGRARRQLVVAEDGTSRVATILRATLSVDHRAIDGATGAQFLAALRRHMEEPESGRLDAGTHS